MVKNMLTFKLQEHYTIFDFKNVLQFLDSLIKANDELEVYDKYLFHDKLQSIKINFLKVYYRRGEINVFKMVPFLKYISIKDIINLIYKK